MVEKKFQWAPISRRVLRSVIRMIEAEPRSYDQTMSGERAWRPEVKRYTCGTRACILGFAELAASRAGVKTERYVERAELLQDAGVLPYAGHAEARRYRERVAAAFPQMTPLQLRRIYIGEWPEPYRSRFDRLPQTQRCRRAKIAVAFLKDLLASGPSILDRGQW